MLACPHCGEEKPDDEFYIAPLNVGRRGRSSWCKLCTKAQTRDYKRRNPEKNKIAPEVARAYHLKRKYGMTPEDFDKMLESQGGRCAICGSDDPGRDWWSTDHDHATGAVRAILCNNCNGALGMLGDSAMTVRAAWHYLEWHEFRQDIEADPDFLAGAPDDWEPGTGAVPDWFLMEVLRD
jgi:hypothetical protein